MTNKKYFNFYNKIANITLYGTAFVFIAYGIMPASAAVVQRTTPAATTATTPRPASSRMPTMTTKLSTVPSDNNNTNTTNNNNNNSGNNTNSQTTDTDNTQPDEIIEDKTSQFDAILESATTGATDASTQSLADLIRAQRAALDAAAAEEFSSKNTQVATSGLSACDSGLRSCMQEKCGSNFTKCAGDGDTIWGDKMDACRRNVTCSGEEYRLFSIEIKADRDLNAKMASYQKILDCGNSYNACIEEQCGATFNKCLGKKAGDAAIAKCASIARDCTQQDSGLAARAMEVFGTLRQDAEKQIKRDEARLYELRDTMRNRCQSLGALFDERSLDCVFTVEFWAGQPTSSLYASKKAYAGSTFDCTQGWFGVDVTTFKENAYRLTRSQTSATSALLGSGVGMAVGSITSGAIDRAIDRHKAEQAVKKAEKEDKEAAKARNGSDQAPECTSDTDCGDGKTCKNNTCVDKTDPAPECTSDGDCGDGKACENNTCVDKTDPAPECTSDSDCGDGKACENNTCVDKTDPAPECTSDSDCGDGKACENNTCVDKTDPAPECTSDSDCESDETCDSGTCKKKITDPNNGTVNGTVPPVIPQNPNTPSTPQCETNSDCSPNQICDNGVCKTKPATNPPTPQNPSNGCFTKDTRGAKRFIPPRVTNERVYWWVGDSRFTGMYINGIIGRRNNEAVVAHAGRGHTWLTSSPTPTGISLLESCLKAGDVVILNLGANDTSKYNAYISTYRSLMSAHPNVTFKIVSVNPVYDGKARLKNSTIETFNTNLKNAFPGNFIDTYSIIKPRVNANNTDSEGLHYRGDGIEQTIYDTIMRSI